MPRCRVCGGNAEYWVPWANSWFCRDHFIEYFERRVWRTYEKYVPKRHRRVLFAVSGGKDSVALLHALAPRLRSSGVEASALFIDLGIGDYSRVAYRVASENADSLGIPLITVRLGDYGFTIDDVAGLAARKIIRRPVCSICGMVKRYLMNKVAFEEEFDLVLTGHTLNDSLAFATQNIYSGSGRELVKIRPYTPGRDGLVARGKPLLFIYEAETRWYTEALGVPVLRVKCPYTPIRKSVVVSLKRMLEDIDKRHPGYMAMAMRNIVDKLIPAVEASLPPERLVKCSRCGMPSSTDPCGFCRLRERIMRLKASPGSDQV